MTPRFPGLIPNKAAKEIIFTHELQNSLFDNVQSETIRLMLRKDVKLPIIRLVRLQY